MPTDPDQTAGRRTQRTRSYTLRIIRTTSFLISCPTRKTATNHTNPEGIAYNYDYTQTKVSQGLPILPFLGLRAEF